MSTTHESDNNIGRQECEGCQKHLATVKRLSEVTYQQAVTIKDQQNTINQLIGQKGVGTADTGKLATTSAPVRKVGAGTSNGAAASRRKAPAKSPAASKAPRRPAHTVMEDTEPKVTRVSKTENNDDEEDTVEVTRIWITGTPNPRTRCPLPECAHRDFSAVDMYHFRRHFMQVHCLTHPNPEFILQCPVDNCIAEYENSLKNIKDHMRKAHPELFDNQKKVVKISTPAKKSKKSKKSKKAPVPLPQEEEEEEDVSEAEGEAVEEMED